MRSTIIIFFLLLFSNTIHSQSFTWGLRTELIDYFIINTQTNTTGNYMLIPPFSLYMKLGAEYKRFGLDVKGGVQLGDPFVGGEYGAELKYSITEHISPLIAWYKHMNGSIDHNSGGTYIEPIHFLGIGAEAEVSRLFSLDLIFYLPVGNNKLEFTKDNYPQRTLLTYMGLMIKLGFIFNIARF